MDSFELHLRTLFFQNLQELRPYFNLDSSAYVGSPSSGELSDLHGEHAKFEIVKP